jgi:hypothetical protein
MINTISVLTPGFGPILLGSPALDTLGGIMRRGAWDTGQGLHNPPTGLRGPESDLAIEGAQNDVPLFREFAALIWTERVTDASTIVRSRPGYASEQEGHPEFLGHEGPHRHGRRVLSRARRTGRMRQWQRLDAGWSYARGGTCGCATGAGDEQGARGVETLQCE